ncbi:hypothetical protein LGM42_03105 [Burkholderia sp. AU39826]|uniref:hypothetical protein n=1 Tax=Burkholderia sp. AU39826 TaxID=2879634 RepID=UPI001CF50B0E|nr:hypothetical protein [Burkholderia sp. AU39826]MCA7968877.1 hypothetical protein [Burkholderia sp. AU39826]
MRDLSAATTVVDAAPMARTCPRRHPLAGIDVPRHAGRYPMNETPLARVAAMDAFAATARPVAIG